MQAVLAHLPEGNSMYMGIGLLAVHLFQVMGHEHMLITLRFFEAWCAPSIAIATDIKLQAVWSTNISGLDAQASTFLMTTFWQFCLSGLA